MKLKNYFFVIFFLFFLGFFIPSFLIFFFSNDSGVRTVIGMEDREKAYRYAPLIEGAYAAQRDWEKVRELLQNPPFSASVPRFVGDPDPLTIQERVLVLNPQRQVVLDSKRTMEQSLHPAEHLHEAVLLGPEDDPWGYLLVGTMVDPALMGDETSHYQTAWLALWMSFGIGLLSALPISLLLALKVTKPLRELAHAVGDWQNDHWTAPEFQGVPQEVAQLSQSFTLLREKLRSTEETKSQMLADTAHEIRTPLFLIQGTLEGMADGIFPLSRDSVRLLHDETVRLVKLVEDLKKLEMIQEEKLNPSLFSWSTLVKGVQNLFAMTVAKKGQTLNVEVFPPEAEGYGDEGLWFQVLKNLLSNAVFYTPQGGQVSLLIRQDSSRTTIDVDDNGPGIPPGMREKVFERLFRLDHARNSREGGRGLGLTIVKDIAQRHGAAVLLLDSQLGGVKVRIDIPATR